MKKTYFQTQVISPLISAINDLSAKNAFCINDAYHTYKQFGENISKIRFSVNSLPQENAYVGLVVNDDIETYASIFALWLEGKAYVPLHPNQPLDRCLEIINQINIHTVLDSATTSRFLDYHVINTSILSFKNDFLDLNDSIDDNRDAYVLFTSGSTGTPKGVRITRTNVGAFMDSFWASQIKITGEDKCLQCFDLTFDISVQSFLVPLTKGACVYTIPHDQIKYMYVYSLFEDHQITFGAMPPSLLRYLKPYFQEIYIPSMKYCVLTAEASPLDLVNHWTKCIPNAKIFNFYGPTEATIYCTYYEVSKSGEIKTLNGMLSIGQPMKNVGAIIIDENYNILSNEKKGELCISGDQVSPGYWNSPQKNATAFFEKKVGEEIRRFYRTGDLCYFDNDNTIMLYGRLDSQAKIQGYRVELGEIEYHVREYLEGNNAVVLTFNNSIGNTELVLFVEGENINIGSLSDYLKTKLPNYMIPTKMIIEPEFPLNANSKVDRRKLKEKIKDY